MIIDSERNDFSFRNNCTNIKSGKV